MGRKGYRPPRARRTGAARSGPAIARRRKLSGPARPLRYAEPVEARSASAGSEAVPAPSPAAAPVLVCHRYHEAVELVGRRWSGAILFSLIDGPHYFSDVAAAVPGVSDRLLSQRLRELEGEGLVERAVHPGPPARVSYRLSESGEALVPALRALYDWAQDWRSDGAGE